MKLDWETFTYDEEWIRQAAQIEMEAGGDIQIGGKPSPVPVINPLKLQAELQKVKILSILFTELRSLLQQANLGAGTDAAFLRGRQLIHTQVSKLSEEQQSYFEALIAEDKMDAGDRPLRAQLNQVLCSLLTRADWQDIAQAAMESVQSHLFEQVSLRLSA